MKAKIQVVRERTGKLVCRYRSWQEPLSLTVAAKIAAGYNVVELIIGQDHYTLANPHTLSHGKNANALANTIVALAKTHWGARIR